MTTTNQVAPGWQRSTIDGKAVYSQTATAIIPAKPTQPVNGSQLIDAWRELARLHGDSLPTRDAQTIDVRDYGRGNGLSSASELKERRDTSAMYLLSYVLLTGGTIAGLVALAMVTGVVGDGAQAFAFWLAGTGIISLGLAAWQHRKELSLTPESLEQERIGADYAIAEIDAQSRQMLAEAHSDAIRLQAQAALEDAQARRLAAQQATQAAMAQAQRQIATHETPQSGMNALANYQKTPTAATAFRRADLDVWQPVIAQSAANAPTGAFVDSARRKLLDWLLEVYADGDAFDGDGYLRKGCVSPLSARSTLTPAERAQVADMLAQLPTWLLRYDAGRKMWQLNAKRYATSAAAIEAIGGTVTRV